MNKYRYRIYKLAGMWLVRKFRFSKNGTVHGPFLGIGNAWDWIADDVRIRNEAMLRERQITSEQRHKLWLTGGWS